MADKSVMSQLHTCAGSPRCVHYDDDMTTARQKPDIESAIPPDEPPTRRILIITHGFPPNQTGGAELQSWLKARWWLARGHSVRVIAADPQAPGTMTFDQVDCSDELMDNVSLLRVRFVAPDASRPLRETFHNVGLKRIIDHEIDTFRPDMLYQVSGYLFGTLPLQIANQHGLPACLFATDYWHQCLRVTLLRPDGHRCDGPRRPSDCAACRLVDHRYAQFAGQRVSRLAWHTASLMGRANWLHRLFGTDDVRDREAEVLTALQHATLVVVESEFLARRLSELGVPSDRLLILRQGLDRTDLRHRGVERGSKHLPLKVLYVGQLAEHKGVDLAIRSAAILSRNGVPVHLTVHGQPTGSAAYLRKLHNLAESCSVSIGAPLNRTEVGRAIAESDVVVVPSRWYDNSPNVILEAFATGVPVIVAGHGGMAEMVRDGVNGLVFEPGSAVSLAKALRRLIVEADLMDTLRSNIEIPHDVDYAMAVEDRAIARTLAAQCRTLTRPGNG